jgi:hypothetical protein
MWLLLSVGLSGEILIWNQITHVRILLLTDTVQDSNERVFPIERYILSSEWGNFLKALQKHNYTSF